LKPFLLILEWSFLLIALGIFTITESYQASIITGLAILTGSFLLRALRCKRIIPQTGLEIPWLIGLSSAAIAAWIAYDRPLAFLQFSRLLAALTLYYSVVDLPSGFVPWLAGGFLLVAACFALYFPIQYDFNASPVKFLLIQQAGSRIHDSIQNYILQNASLISLQNFIIKNSIHPNVAAGTLAVAVPFGIAMSWENLRKKTNPLRLSLGLLSLLLTMLIFGSLALTSSRGAITALIGTGLLTLLAFIQLRWFQSKTARRYFWTATLTVGLLSIIVLAATGIINNLIGGIPDPSGTIQSRTVLWKQGLELIGDYGFTGSGLMTFWMVHGGYNLQLFIPFIAHVHNTFLETWIEQGILGVIALLSAGMVITLWFWKALQRQNVMILGWAGLAAVCVMFLHGLVDVVFSVSRTLPLTGFILGYAWMVNLKTAHDPQPSTEHKTTRLPDWALYTAGISIALGVGVILLLWRPLLSKWYANQGALAQTRLELSQYDPSRFESLSIDDIRRNAPPRQLEPITSAFNMALALDPENRTALQRMAQIAFSLDEYEKSLTYTQKLWNAGYRDDTTRLLYGDALIANGDLSGAENVLRGLTWAEDRLMTTAWYRYWINDDIQRAADFWQVVLMLNPDNSDANHWSFEAQSKIKENTSP
jgi:hypothetical protein